MFVVARSSPRIAETAEAEKNVLVHIHYDMHYGPEMPPYPAPDEPSRTDLVYRARKRQAINSEIYIGYCLPPRFIPNPQISGMTVRFIVSEYEPLFELVFFRPMQTLMRIVRERFVSQVTSSALIHWSSYIGAQMIRALRQDGEQANIQRFLPWLDRLDRIATESKNDVSLDDLTGRLCGALEVCHSSIKPYLLARLNVSAIQLMFLKHITADVKTGYALLRRMAPLFMQVASADPMLWPRDPASNGISLAHALACGQYEIGRFIFVDMITSLMSGLPPLVEYDTSHPVIHSHGGYPMEHIHGCPTQFAFSIVRINQWRARHPHGGLEENTDWRVIEKEVWEWRPSCDNGPDSESLRLVMRLALQEAWRHALLIYLYMVISAIYSLFDHIRLTTAPRECAA
ncbi:hypothetical protein FRC12_002620 [Ceratobasidium sp. 428]|nr:hypothetical protein FRC12_002620 [Ceratobasidium sp. 428]